MEEKNGRIVEIVESTEVQKQQKKNKRNLRIMIASLIVAGSVGYGAMNLSRGDSKEEQPAVSTEYQISPEFDGVEISNISTDKDGKTAEEAKSIPSLYAVVTSKDGKTTDTSYVLTTDASNVKLEDNQRLVLVEHYTEDELNSSFLYQKEVRQVSMDDQGALLQAGEWQPTGDYDIRDDAPKNSVSTRYVFKGTLGMALENNSVIEMPTVVLSTETKTVNPILEDEIRWSNIFEDAYEWYSVNGQANTEAPNASLYADSYKKVGDSTGAPETTEAYAWNQGKIAGLRHLYENTQDASLLSKIDAELQRTDKLKNISDTLDREDAISTLMSMGDSEKEALEKIRAAEEQAVSGQSEKTNSELDSSTVGFTEYMAEKVQNKVNNFNEYAQSVTSQDVLTDGQISELNQQAQNTVKSIYDDQFNALHDYYETVQANQPSFPTLQSSDVDRQQFLDKANQKIFEMDQMLSDTNEQSVSEGKTR